MWRRRISLGRNKVGTSGLTSRFLLLLCLLVWACVALAQTVSGTLRGQVTDPSGAAIPRATVSAKPPSGEAITAQTNGEGAYELKGLAPGKYSVTAVAKGFTPSCSMAA